MAPLPAEAARWQPQARRWREAADGLATAPRDLTERARRSEAIATRARARVDGLIIERDQLIALPRRLNATLEAHVGQ